MREQNPFLKCCQPLKVSTYFEREFISYYKSNVGQGAAKLLLHVWQTQTCQDLGEVSQWNKNLNFFTPKGLPLKTTVQHLQWRAIQTTLLPVYDVK